MKLPNAHETRSACSPLYFFIYALNPSFVATPPKVKNSLCLRSVRSNGFGYAILFDFPFGTSTNRSEDARTRKHGPRTVYWIFYIQSAHLLRLSVRFVDGRCNKRSDVIFAESLVPLPSRG